jgi:hypothetical protein
LETGKIFESHMAAFGGSWENKSRYVTIGLMIPRYLAHSDGASALHRWNETSICCPARGLDGSLLNNIYFLKQLDTTATVSTLWCETAGCTLINLAFFL